MSNHVRVGKTNAAILAGEADLSVWSEEELLRGRRRDAHGRWSGRPPRVVPSAVHQELTRRRMSEAFDLLRTNLVAATEVLVTLAVDPEVDDTVRLKAATTILDRVLGKAPERVELSTTPAWATALQAAIVERGPVVEVVSTTVESA